MKYKTNTFSDAFHLYSTLCTLDLLQNYQEYLNKKNANLLFK